MISLQGQLLVASSKLVDPNFFRSVVLIVQHGEEGALGLVLNRPLKLTVKRAWKQICDAPCLATGSLHQGGPCDGPLMVIHGNKALSDIEIADGLHFSTEKETVESLVGSGEGTMKFFIGYSGWSSGQLEDELEEGGWLLSPAHSDSIFSGKVDPWDRLIKILARGAMYPYINPKLIPEDPSVN